MTDFDEKLDRLTDYSGIDQKIENDKKPHPNRCGFLFHVEMPF